MLTVWSFVALPESHPKSKRQSLHPVALAKSYFEILRSPTFWALAAIPAFSFQIFMQYIGAAHPFLAGQLGLHETQFGYLFIPLVVGFMLSSFISGRTAGRWSNTKTIWVAHLLMIAPAVFSVIWHMLSTPNIVASIGPLFIATAGIAMAAPITQVLIMELMPARRGLAASCQAFTQLIGSAITLGVVSIAISGSTLNLAFGHLGWTLLSLGGWIVYLAIQRGRR